MPSFGVGTATVSLTVSPVASARCFSGERLVVGALGGRKSSLRRPIISSAVRPRRGL